jgi:hypothetical protein
VSPWRRPLLFSNLQRTVDDEGKDHYYENYEPANRPESDAKSWFVAWRLGYRFGFKRVCWYFHSSYMTSKGCKGNTTRTGILHSFVKQKPPNFRVIHR